MAGFCIGMRVRIRLTPYRHLVGTETRIVASRFDRGEEVWVMDNIDPVTGVRLCVTKRFADECLDPIMPEGHRRRTTRWEPLDTMLAWAARP